MRVFFYFFAPFIFPFFLKIDCFKYLELVIVLWLGLVIFTLIAQTKNWSSALDFYIFNPLPRSTEFLLGTLGARWIKAVFRFNSVITSLFVMLMPVLIYCLLVPEISECPAMMNLLFIPGAFLLILSIAGKECDGDKLWLKKTYFIRLGDASFALYMTHALLLGLFTNIIIRSYMSYFYSSWQHETTLTIFYLVIAVIFSLAVHSAFEAPARKILMSFVTSRRNII